MKTPAIIDVAHFQDAGIKNSLIVDFLKLYEIELITLPEQFKALMLASDYLGAERLLHSFKGASEVVGANHVAALSTKLEKLIHADDKQFDSLVLVAEFKQEVDATQVGVKKMIAALS
jgi:HPt (histidine-containing phosphotransfer) domain-containing protein